MNIVDKVARSKGSLILAGAIAGALWAGAFWANENVWDGAFARLPRSWRETRWSDSVHFFVYDVIKIALLLVIIIFAVTVLRSFLSIERTRAMLGGKREGVGNVLASLLGVAAPFCSCSAVPAFIGFVGAGVPIGVTLSFLIASPLVNEVAIGLLWSSFGWRIALMYVAAGFTIAVVAGWVLGRFKAERWVEPFVLRPLVAASAPPAPGGRTVLAVSQPGTVAAVTIKLNAASRIRLGLDEVKTLIGKIWPYLLVGVGLGAAIHGWAPTDLFARVAGPDNPFGVLIAVLLGIPLYSNAAGALPLVDALADKGVPMGTLLAFMMSVVALSLPEMILLKRVLKLPLIAAFIGVVGLGIIGVGYLFNAILT